MLLFGLDAMTLLLPIALLVLMIPLVVALVRANEVFFLRLSAGRLERVRGDCPAALLGEFQDIARQAPMQSATLRGVIESKRVALYAEGDWSPEQKQRLKNVIGMWSPNKFRR